MASSSSSNRRRDTEMAHLMMAGFHVEPINDSIHKFHVHFHGPADSPYFGGVWNVRVELPDDYPYESPSVGFANKIYHPNIELLTGVICVNVLNENWSPMCDLATLFNIYLPQLLLDPNPSDPMNENAADLFLIDRPTYEARVREYIDQYAKPINDGVKSEESGDEEPSEDGKDSDVEPLPASPPVDP